MLKGGFNPWPTALSEKVLIDYSETERAEAISALKVCHGLGFGLAGTHRTGKTTLAKKLSETLGLPFLETSVKAIAAEYGFDVDHHSDFDARMDWQEYLLGRLSEKYEAMGDTAFVTDRTPLCMMAYTLADAPNGPITQAMDDRVKAYMDACMALTERHFALVGVIQSGIKFEPVAGAPAFNAAYQEKVSAVVVASALELKSANIFILEKDCTDLGVRHETLLTEWNDVTEYYTLGIQALPAC